MRRLVLQVSVFVAALAAALSVATPAVSAHILWPSRAPASQPPAVTVQSGDTLTALAETYGTTWVALAGWNHLPDPNLIAVGQLLMIPPAGYVPPPTGTARVAAVTVDASSGSTGVLAASGSVWGCIAGRESGGDAAENTGNGFYGAFQDTLGSWRAAGGPPGLPSDYPYSVQLAVNERIQQQQGWGAWPQTSRMCGV